MAFEEKYGALPSVSESTVESVMCEADKFAAEMKHDPQGARRSLEDEIKWLKENKDFLGRAVEASIDPALSLVEDKLTHKDWVELRCYLIKGVLLTLQMINEALKEHTKREWSR